MSTWKENKRRMGLLSKAMGRHPSFPLVRRIFVYWGLIAFLLIFALSTRGTPFGKYTLVPCALASAILLWLNGRQVKKVRRALKILREEAEDEKRPGMIHQARDYIRDTKRSF